MENIKNKSIGLAKELFGYKKAEIDKEFNIKDITEPLRYEIASELNLVNKKGETDIKQVPEALLRDAVLIIKAGKENKLEAKYEMQQEFIRLIEEGGVYSDMADQIAKAESEKETIQTEFKDTKKEFTLLEEDFKELEEKGADEKQFMKETSEVVSLKAKEYTQLKKEELSDKETENKNVLADYVSKALFDIVELFKKI